MPGPRSASAWEVQGPMSNFDDRFNQAVVDSANMLLRHVVPLFSIRPGKRPILIGTSLLVERAGTYYLVSARHVVDRSSDPGGLYYYIERGSMHRLLGSVLHTQAQPHLVQIDKYDVAVIALAPDALPPGAAVWKLPLPFSSLRPFQFPRRRKQYLVTGFPSSRSRANPHSRRLVSEPSGFRVVSATQDRYTILGLDEEHHIVLALDIANMNFPDGTQRRIADPHGMSGSPVWLLFDEDGRNNSSVTPAVGVVTEYHRDKRLLVATDIAVAVHLINESVVYR
jgi:hypothetical protein